MNGDNYIPLDAGDGGRRDRGHRGDRESRREREDRRERDRERGGDRGDRRDRGDRDGDRDRGDRDRGGDRRRRSRSAGRRRSRSPHRRREETDTYSSSRDHRAREREDRYRGDRGDRNDRGDDRWARDRAGDRRDRRDDDRPPRRDLLDDRGGRDRRGGGGGGGGGGGRDPPAERKRSASPPRKPKEPTPDLTDVVSVLDRKRRLTQWDIKPTGYDNVTAEHAKLSGMFPLPGAPRQQAMDPTRLQAFMNQPANAGVAESLKPSNARQSKRLFVYNIPAGTSSDQLTDFFNLQVNNYNVISGTDPVVATRMSKDKTFAMLEFRSSEDATTTLGLDGISMTEASNGAANGHSTGLSLRRPKDYIAPGAALTVDEDGNAIVASFEQVPDSPNKLLITHLSRAMTGDQVMQVISAFGELKHFVAVTDRHSDAFEGMAFAEYQSEESTQAALAGLAGMEIGGETIQVKHAAMGLKQAADMAASANAMSMLASVPSEMSTTDMGRVLQLLNMVTAEELMDNVDYQEILEDVREECSKFGQVLDLKIPRPSGARTNPGVGKIFVKFDGAESAQKALKALAGRKFNDRTVVVTTFSEEYFDVEAW